MAMAKSSSASFNAGSRTAWTLADPFWNASSKLKKESPSLRCSSNSLRSELSACSCACMEALKSWENAWAAELGGSASGKVGMGEAGMGEARSASEKVGMGEAGMGEAGSAALGGLMTGTLMVGRGVEMAAANASMLLVAAAAAAFGVACCWSECSECSESSGSFVSSGCPPSCNQLVKQS